MDWAERLGYHRPVLIYQGDDLGLGEPQTKGIAQALLAGAIDTASGAGDFHLTVPAESLAGQDIGLHVVAPECTSYRETTALMHRQYDALARSVLPSHIDSHGGCLFHARTSTMAYIHFAREKRIPPLMWSGANPYPVADLFHLSGFPLLAGVHTCHGPPRQWVDGVLRDVSTGIHLLIFHPREGGEELGYLLETPRPLGYDFANWRQLGLRFYAQAIGGIIGGAPPSGGGAPPAAGSAPTGAPMSIPIPAAGSAPGGA